MFGPEQLVELPIVGLLILFAITPLITLAIPKMRDEPGFCPPLMRIKGEDSRGSAVSLLIVAAFIIGAVGNEMIDAVVSDEWSPTAGHNYEKLYQRWLDYNPCERLKTPTLEHAEHQLGHANEFTRAYLLRHDSITRVLRAAAVASLLLIFSMFIYVAAARRRRWTERRYSGWHFLVVVLVSAGVIYTYFEEVGDVQKKLFELKTQTTVKVFRDIAPAQCATCVIAAP